MHKEKVLNLRGIKFENKSLIIQEIELALDKFLMPIMQQRSGKIPPAKIVVGKGMNSGTLFKGKNFLRVCTESYLQRLGLEFRDGSYYEGQEGVIVVNF